jgi:YD repeat-containing protein
LQSATDPQGIVSLYGYDNTNFLNTLTTPYGTTTFNTDSDINHQAVQATNPLGQTERAELRYNSISAIADSEASTPSVSGMLLTNSGLSQNNTYYWDRRQYTNPPVYTNAVVTHWMTGLRGLTNVADSRKQPLEGRVWYNYSGQTTADNINDSALNDATISARVLDSGGTQASLGSYSSMGMITQSVDPLGRTTNYSYATNGIDLTQVTQANGTGQDILSAMTYNSQHEPLTATDASGQTTTMTYNEQGQILTREDALSETTTLAYDGSGYLTSVTGPVTGATTGYTYDSAGRVHTVTDSEGYVITMAYDNLDRPVSSTYPDGTTDQTLYDGASYPLDVAHSIDRQGRVTTSQYDAIRELIQTTDPLGRTTKYGWCTCGGLATLTDANGHLTTWNHDLQGRVTSKVYADSSQITYTFETTTSRLHSMTDARGNQAAYAYNTDNTLSGTTYTPASGVSSTPNVSFTYDTVYNRVSGMTDGTGTTSYSYNAITGSITTGAGRLASINVPIAGSTAAVAYGYDALGRVTSRTVDGANPVGTTFDALGRVTKVTNALTLSSTSGFVYAYVDTTSRLSSVTYPTGTGLSTTYSYFGNTGDQRLQDITNLKGSTTLSKFDYTYNPVGTIATWQQQADSSTAVVNTLSYDGADQLTSAVQSGGASASNAYRYDPAGNRLAETTGSGTTAGQFNNLNQLTGLSGSTTNKGKRRGRERDTHLLAAALIK